MLFLHSFQDQRSEGFAQRPGLEIEKGRSLWRLVQSH